MSFPHDIRHTPAATNPPEHTLSAPFSGVACYPHTPLTNLCVIQSRMDTLQKFLSDSVNANTLLGQTQMEMVSSEISSAIQQIIVNGTAILTRNHNPDPIPPKENPNPKVETHLQDDDYEIIELDSVELLAEHVHFCEICGKGFKRDANLRMHMRAHGNRFKTPEALAKPEKSVDSITRRVRFSCPFVGCNRNRHHGKFRPLKTAICVKNHFRRSHCPKVYSCDRCNTKSFSVLADLRSHLKHCGESRWKCSCGTSFSRKDKLFGHVALFEGHMPAVIEEEKGKGITDNLAGGSKDDDDGFFVGLDSIDDYCFQEMLNSPNSGSGIEGFFNF